MEIKTEEDLLGLIHNKIPEDTNMDYKSPKDLENPNKNKDIAKDVSAMANSNGGIIIYGIEEDERGFPKEINWVEDRKLKDKLYQVIHSQIVPEIKDLTIKEIPSNEGAHKFAILINVPPSDIAPHQAHIEGTQRRFFRRHGSISAEMEYYEIKDLFFARKSAFLEISLKPLKSKNPSFDINIQNNGKVIAEKLFIKILVPKGFEIYGNGWKNIGEGFSPSGIYSVYQFFDNVMPVYPQNCSQIGIISHPEQNLLIKNLTLGFLMVSTDSELKVGRLTINSNSIEKIEILNGSKSLTLTIDPTFEEKIEYLKDKEGIPFPSVSFFD